MTETTMFLDGEPVLLSGTVTLGTPATRTDPGDGDTVDEFLATAENGLEVRLSDRDRAHAERLLAEQAKADAAWALVDGRASMEVEP
jgi:hypothetical protein